MWDGNSWYSLNLDHDDGVIDCIEIYNNQIYVGSFNFVKTHIFRYTGSLKVGELKVNAEIKFYPNPVTSVLNVKIKLKGNNSIVVEIHNLEGKRVLKTKVNVLEENEISVNLSRLSSGTFIVLLKDEKSGSFLHQEKIIIQ